MGNTPPYLSAYTSSFRSASHGWSDPAAPANGGRSPMRMCSCILLAGIFSPVMGDTRYSSGARAGGSGLEAEGDRDGPV